MIPYIMEKKKMIETTNQYIVIVYPIGSMVLVYIYMLTWLGYIDGIHVTIYSSTMDPMGIVRQHYQLWSSTGRLLLLVGDIVEVISLISTRWFDLSESIRANQFLPNLGIQDDSDKLSEKMRWMVRSLVALSITYKLSQRSWINQLKAIPLTMLSCPDVLVDPDEPSTCCNGVNMALMVGINWEFNNVNPGWD